MPTGVRDRQRHAVGHAVRDADELDGERADGDGVARLDGLAAGRRASMPCSSSFGSTSASVMAVPYTGPSKRHHVRHGADVILVAVRQDQRLDLVAPRLDVGHVGNDQIDAELVGIRKHDAGVDEDRRVLPRHGHHVHAELAEASQCDDLERGRRHDGYGGLIHRIPAQATASFFSTESLALAGGDTGYQAAGSA